MVIMKPSTKQTRKTKEIFLRLERSEPIELPIGIIATSAPSVNIAIPMTRSTADTVKSATVPLSTSSEHREATIIKTAIGRTEKKDSLNFEKIFLNIRLAYRPLSNGRLMT